MLNSKVDPTALNTATGHESLEKRKAGRIFFWAEGVLNGSGQRCDKWTVPKTDIIKKTAAPACAEWRSDAVHEQNYYIVRSYYDSRKKCDKGWEVKEVGEYVAALCKDNDNEYTQYLYQEARDAFSSVRRRDVEDMPHVQAELDPLEDKLVQRDVETMSHEPLPPITTAPDDFWPMGTYNQLCLRDHEQVWPGARHDFCDKCPGAADGTLTSEQVVQCSLYLDQIRDDKAWPSVGSIGPVFTSTGFPANDEAKGSGVIDDGLCYSSPEMEMSKVREQYCNECGDGGLRCDRLAQQVKAEDDYGISLPPFDGMPRLNSVIRGNKDKCEKLCERTVDYPVTAWDGWCNTRCNGLQYVDVGASWRN